MFSEEKVNDYDLTPQQLENEIAKVSKRLESLRSILDNKRRQCQHNWGPTRYTPDVQEAYTIPGDPPGTMGVDWRGPCYVPRQETPRWSRVCQKCGKVDMTSRVKERVEKEPDFGA